jgi:glucokinase
MMEAAAPGRGAYGSPAEVGVLGSVGRKRMSFALTDAAGGLAVETIRHFDAATTTSVSGALTDFQRQLQLPALPRRAAMAVAGLARGDSISITKTRWFLSRSGLGAMLGTPPLILNDFEAEAWALYARDARPQEVFAGSPSFSLRQPGCYLIVGITSGLGVAVVQVADGGAVTVLPTEAGHAALVGGGEEFSALVTDIHGRRWPVQAEDVISAPGLAQIYAALAKRNGSAGRLPTPEEVTRSAGTDRIARHACELLCQAFWTQVGNMVLSVGAWDGVVVIGKAADALRPLMRRPEAQGCFAASGKYQRQLLQVPRVFVAQEQGALAGAAEAMRHRLPVG